MKFFILAASCWALTIFGASPATAQKGQDNFYILMRDAGSAKMLLLDSVDGGPTNTSVMVLDVFKLPIPALLQTLEFNCPKKTFAVVYKRSFTPDHANENKSRGPSQRIPNGSQLAFIGDLVCAGKGNLERSKVIQSTLTDIVQSYWRR